MPAYDVMHGWADISLPMYIAVFAGMMLVGYLIGRRK